MKFKYTNPNELYTILNPDFLFLDEALLDLMKENGLERFLSKLKEDPIKVQRNQGKLVVMDGLHTAFQSMQFNLVRVPYVPVRDYLPKDFSKVLTPVSQMIPVSTEKYNEFWFSSHYE